MLWVTILLLIKVNGTSTNPKNEARAFIEKNIKRPSVIEKLPLDWTKQLKMNSSIGKVEMAEEQFVQMSTTLAHNLKLFYLSPIKILWLFFAEEEITLSFMHSRDLSIFNAHRHLLTCNGIPIHAHTLSLSLALSFTHTHMRTLIHSQTYTPATHTLFVSHK